VLALYNAASTLASTVDINTSNGSGETDDLAAIQAAFNASADAADQARVTATVTDEAALAEIAIIVAEKETLLTDATTAESDFTSFKDSYESAADANPVVERLETAQARATLATANIATLTALLVEEASAQAQVDELALLDAAIVSAELALTELSLVLPVTITEDIAATSGNDLFVAGADGAAISDFGLLGSDALYIGTGFTFNASSVAGADSESALLEMWLTQVGEDTLVSLETSPLGANAAEVEGFSITLTGIPLASIVLEQGFISLL